MYIQFFYVVPKLWFVSPLESCEMILMVPRIHRTADFFVQCYLKASSQKRCCFTGLFYIDILIVI
jgi:hypothetical protein